MALKIGIQMYSVRNAMRKNAVETIGKVSEIGYKYIELANLNADTDTGCGFGASPETLNAAIAHFGDKIVSAHIDPFNKDNVEKVIEYHLRLGTECLMSKVIDVTYEGVVRQCELLNYIGEKCREAGLKHCLHTGIIPFVSEEKDILDVYTENTDEGTLFFEFDTYWALRSGNDPVEMIKKHGNRIKMIHQKDIPAKTETPVNLLTVAPLDAERWMKFYSENIGKADFTEIGQGIMNIQGIIDATLKYTDAQYIILEQDFTYLDEFDSIKLSMEGMKKLNGLELN